ncbi:MAG TPA: hypothetical protein VNK52_16245 [Hyphomicrobiaceae bacterium]|nr:hypothetical protein [Hyphomicrobiaceae bacterium]
MTNNTKRGALLLDAIHDDVHRRLNPDDEDCWNCGGEGYVHDCFDGFCASAEDGCEDCTQPCPECVDYKRQFAKAVREEVIKCGSIDVAIAWLKSIGRWSDDVTPDRVQTELAAALSLLSKAPAPRGGIEHLFAEEDIP